MTDNTLTIRTADAADAGALTRLAALDSSRPPTRSALVAEVGDEMWAAIEIGSGAAIADPFRPSGDLVELLRHRAAALRGEAARARAFGRRVSRLAELFPST